MSPQGIKKTISIGDGKDITIETGRLAKQADGSVVIRQGNCMLLATVVAAKEAREGVDFMPLSVDYQEKFASAGKIPGGFLKREGRLSDHEILVSRLIDRALRPLFPDDYHAETQVLISLISHDESVMPDALAALGASAALAVSDIPFGGPISEVRVGRVDGKYVVNPSFAELKESDIDIIVAATEDNIMMVEGEMKEVSEAEMMETIKVAHDAIKVHCAVQKELEAEVGKTEKREYSHETNDEALAKQIHEMFYDKILDVVKKHLTNKSERGQSMTQFRDEYLESLSEEERAEKGSLIKKYYHDVEKEAVRNHVLDDRIRLDGRKLDQIRAIWSEVDYLPSAHGSAIFTRGETQSLCTVTLGTKLDEKMIDGATMSGTDKFMLHYNFPPFSTGEARFMRGPGRREVGHGNLAFRALKHMIPTDSAYTIRIVSDILESNGSSSMATVCGGTLALMDSGIQIKKPVSGIAMGLIADKNSGKYAVLSDILGDEDHLGDMDFKVTGTTDGITACQMDIKVDGLSFEILAEALEQAKQGRLHILGEMMKTIEANREDVKSFAPRNFKMTIDKEKIGAVIGPGGKIIQEIQAETNTTIIIEEIDGRGHVSIFATDKDAMDASVRKVKAIVAEAEVGETYSGKVKSIQPYGAFVEFMPGKDGLLHVSEIMWERVDNVEDVMKVGEEIEVKLVDIDARTGKFKLSRKVLLPKPEKQD